MALSHRSRSLLLAALLSVSFFAPLCRGAVVISEIMFNPQGTDEDAAASPPFDREWVELFNTGAEAVDLSGWQFGDVQDGQWATPLPAGTVLHPQQALVITGDVASFEGNWGFGLNRVQVNSFPTLANTVGTNEGAALRNGMGVLQDVVQFQNVGWPTANGSDGNSVMLLPHALTTAGNDVASNWIPSSQGVYGTRWTNRAGLGENHGSPGIVVAESQAPLAPSPDAAWSMVVFPDTQNYSKSSINLPIFSQLTNWVKDNRDAYGIKLVLQEGDIVNQNSQVTPTSGDQTANQQWANARAAMSVLDGYVPYIMAAGNHDLGTTSAQTRDTQFNDYFKPWQNSLVDPAQGGILKGQYVGGELENSYFELTAPDGRNLLVFSLEFWPRQEVVDWANSVAERAEFENHTAVLLTHSYLNWNNQRMNADPSTYGVGGDSHDGEQLWHELVKLHGSFEMTFSGHVGGDGVGYLRSLGVDGNPVHQMMINSQFETNGGNGWLRLLEFLEDGKTVRVRTYSPFLGVYRTDPANQFEISLSQLPMTPADFNADGAVDSLDLDVWKSHFGLAAGAQRLDGDADGDEDVDGADFLVWQQNLGSVSPGAPVPEPGTAWSIGVAAAALVGGRRRRAVSQLRAAR
jgi:hypothetical protein